MSSSVILGCGKSHRNITKLHYFDCIGCFINLLLKKEVIKLNNVKLTSMSPFSSGPPASGEEEQRVSKQFAAHKMFQCEGTDRS